MDRLYDAVCINDRRIPIPYTVVAMTDDDAAALTGTENMSGKVLWSLTAALTQLAPLGLGTLPQFQQRYGQERLDWKPFLGTITIGSLLDQLINQINGLPSFPAGVRFNRHSRVL